MKKLAFFFAGAAMLLLASCNKAEVEPVAQEGTPASGIPVTKSFGLKTPVLSVYVETNDENILNAGDYTLPDGQSLIDIVEIFAANIHLSTDGTQPTLYLNDKLTNVLENGGVSTYVQPLQNKGIAVLLTVLGDWAGIGVSNMTDTQTTQFAQILAYVVNHYGLDGIGFDDEYANYSSTNNTSYSQIITKLRALLPNKIITVFDWGYSNTISTAALSAVNYVYHGYFGYYLANSWSNISGVPASKWSPLSLELGNSYSSTALSTIQNYASNAASTYGALMCFNLRKNSEVDPLPAFQAIASGAGWGTVTCSNGNRSRDAGSVDGGYEITYAMATAN